MSVHLKNISGHALIVNGRLTEEDEVVTVEGELSKDSPADGFLIGDRLYPAAVWTVEESK